MKKTTVYLPDDLKALVTREAHQRGIPEAEVIRQAISGALARPRPSPGLFASAEPLAQRAEDLLADFGDR